MAQAVPDWEGIKREIDREFIRTLKENLVFASLMPPPRFVRDMGIQTLEAKSYGEETGKSFISMEVPEFQPTDGAGPATVTIKIPKMGRDMHYSEEQALQAAASGVDTVEAEEKAFSMARDIDDFLAFGNTDLGIKGVLNHTDVLTVDNSASTNWTVGSDIVKDLNAAVAKLLDKQHYGPFVLALNPLDSDLLGAFITNTSVQAEDKLNRTIQPGIVYTKRVAQNKAYLVEFNARNFRPVVPRDIGAVGRPLRREWTDPITGAMRMRKMTALGLQIRHGDGACAVTFDRV